MCGHGISLRVENGSLAIKNGFTHFPQEQETFRYFRGDLDRPARIVVLDGSGHLTFDVLDWLAEQDVPLLRVSWTGDVVTVAGGSGYSADREKVAWQQATRNDPERRIAFASELIQTKIVRAAENLTLLHPKPDTLDQTRDKLAECVVLLRRAPPTSITALQGLEGGAAQAYFQAWRQTPLRWKKSKRHPIPPDWEFFGSRASVRATKKIKNRNATHPINAMLNYGYAVAVGQTKIRALANGYDPSLGIMHHEYREGPAFALDLVEPVRPLVDRAVIGFALEDELQPADFVLRADGACRLNPQMARHVVQLVAAAEQRSGDVSTGW
ncbi:CRISPR-associated endonuclease Cas1 [Methylobacterium nigriterrae]|uniref:CRISPR-associated endonuclease Cas1 n=1 Tax=Methylobacterium nigriterrae TaxID=3127512 RepID=UPI00301335F7